VALGSWLGYTLFLRDLDIDVAAAQLTGMVVAGHIGGSANFNAVGIEYGIIDAADVFLTALAVDHLFIALWIGVTALLPSVFSHLFPSDSSGDSVGMTPPAEHEPPFNVRGIALTLSAGLVVLWASNNLHSWLEGSSFQVPTILLVTTFALVLAQIGAFRKIAAYRVVAEFFVAVFLIVVGAHTNLDAIVANLEIAVAVAGLVATILIVHSVVIFAAGRLIGIGAATLAVASQACIGGPVSAAALAEVIDREDLVVPAILVGTLGAALGTFIGIFFAAIL
jgi:uncharacterized membrane protein